MNEPLTKAEREEMRKRCEATENKNEDWVSYCVSSARAISDRVKLLDSLDEAEDFSDHCLTELNAIRGACDEQEDRADAAEAEIEQLKKGARALDDLARDYRSRAERAEAELARLRPSVRLENDSKHWGTSI